MLSREKYKGEKEKIQEYIANDPSLNQAQRDDALRQTIQNGLMVRTKNNF